MSTNNCFDLMLDFINNEEELFNVTQYLINLDKKRFVNNNNLYDTNKYKSDCQANNVRLSEITLYKYLQMAQIFYYSLYEKELFNSSFSEGWENGPVISPLRRKIKEEDDYLKKMLIEDINKIKLLDDKKEFLKKFYEIFINYTIDDLIEFTHWDPMWQEIHNNNFHRTKNKNLMNVSKYAQIYKIVLKDELNMFK